MHEYTVIGHPRKIIMFYIALFSIFISHFITNYLNQWIGKYLNTTATLSLSGITIFGVIYLIFNHCLWKHRYFEKIFHFPNLDGEWKCVGLSNNIELKKQFNWEGTFIIKQSWDKILISLKTEGSSSRSMSVTGGLKYFPGVGYKLSYHYENTPIDYADDLKKHDGFCILTFVENMKSADGCYFNNIKDRQSYGTMVLERR